MKLSTAISLLAGAAPLVSAAAAPKLERKMNYDGYKAYSIATHHNPAAIKAKLTKFAAIPFNLDNDEHLDIAIPAEEVAAFEALGLETQLMHEDLGADIAEEGTFAPYTSMFCSSTCLFPERLPGSNKQEGVGAQAVPSLTWFNSYHAYADHITFFNDLQASFPNASEIFTIGKSFQGRDIFGIHIWGSGGKGSKPAIYFHGTVHAREWISAKVVEYITYHLLTQYATDAAVRAIRDKFDFYILPVVNPDGVSAPNPPFVFTND